jgi:hypothetical protein
MANQFVTLKDITALKGGDAVVGLVDNIVNVAPEIDLVLGRPITDIYYNATIMTAVGSNAGFRSIGGGVQLSAPSFDRKRFNCFPFDCQMEVPEDYLEEANADNPVGSILSFHASAAMRQKALELGKQFYLGSANDAGGPPGLIDFLAVQRTQVDSRTGLKIDQVVDAGGTAAGKCQTVWFIKQGPQGVHWLFGKGQGIRMNTWRQQRTSGADSTANTPTYRTAWVANTFGWIGTSMANYHAVGAIINVDATIQANGTYTYPLTDALVSQLWAKFPITEKPDLCFATQNAIASLQASRTVTNMVQSGNRDWTSNAAPTAAWPTNLPTAGNIRIIPTDSIVPSSRLILN